MTTSADWTRERQRRLELKELYDDYADTYEGDLLGADGKGGKGSLGYRTPNHLEDALLSRPGRLAADVEAGVLSRLDALDLGCGTGLMGVLLRPHCRGRLVGCDLSKRMLKVGAANHPGVYDDLVAAECVSFLSARPPASADLVVAADVFPYLFSLSDVAAAAQAALCVGGVFCFSTEACRLGRAVATWHASTPSSHPCSHPSTCLLSLLYRLDECGGQGPGGAEIPCASSGWVQREETERIAHSAECASRLKKGLRRGLGNGFEPRPPSVARAPQSPAWLAQEVPPKDAP